MPALFFILNNYFFSWCFPWCICGCQSYVCSVLILPDKTRFKPPLGKFVFYSLGHVSSFFKRLTYLEVSSDVFHVMSYLIVAEWHYYFFAYDDYIEYWCVMEPRALFVSVFDEESEIPNDTNLDPFTFSW